MKINLVAVDQETADEQAWWLQFPANASGKPQDYNPPPPPTSLHVLVHASEEAHEMMCLLYTA